MFLGLEWYWWIVILAILIVSIPFKLRFLRWWENRQKEKNSHEKWGEKDD